MSTGGEGGLSLLVDTPTNWSRQASRRALAVGAAGAIDAVLTTSGPFANLTVGRSVQRALGVAWVADLRDPVSMNVLARGWMRPLVRASRLRHVHAARAADAVVAATQQVVDVDGPRLRAVPHLAVTGYDEALWAAARVGSTPARDVFEVVFAGVLYENYRQPDVFLDGLRTAVDRLPAEQKQTIRFSYYGRSGGLLRRLAEASGTDSVVVDHGFVAPDQIPHMLARAAALLLLTNDVSDSGVPGGKLYEYFGARRPIIAVPGKDNVVREMLAATGVGVVANTADDVANTLTSWVAAWKAGSDPVSIDEAAIAEYSSDALGQRVDHLLRRAVEARRGSSALRT